MRKIMHYIKEYEPKVKLLCGCRDGYTGKRDDITCKRCIKSLRAKGQLSGNARRFNNESQMDIFKHNGRMRWLRIKIGRLGAIMNGWLKSKFKPNDACFVDGTYSAPDQMHIVGVWGAGGTGPMKDLSDQLPSKVKTGEEIKV